MPFTTYLLHTNGIAITFIVQAAEDARKSLQELHDEVSCLHCVYNDVRHIAYMLIISML